MSKRYSIAEARNQLTAIVHDAEKGKPVELTRRGKPVAVLMSLAEYERLARSRPDFWSAVQDFRERTDLGDLDVDAVFGDVADRSPGGAAKW